MRECRQSNDDILIGRSVYAGEGQFTQEEYDLIIAQKFESYENMSLADFNRRILEYGEEHGQVYLDAMEHVIGGIGSDDPNAVFLLNTLRSSGEENACKHYQSFGKYRNPEFYGEASKGIDEQIIDGTLYYDWQIGLSYKIGYTIIDESGITVSERDQFIQDYLQGMQDFVNAKSQADWLNMTENEIQTVVMDELNRLSEKYSNEYIQVANVEFLGSF